MSDSIPVSTLPLGAYGANSFAGFTSQTGVVQSLNFYGTTAKYIIGNDNTLLTAQTIATLRSQEITTWFRKGHVYLRLAGGTALYFQMNGDADFWDFGFVTGFSPGAPLSGGQIPGNYTSLAGGALTAIPGYDGANTAGQEFTFGCNGFSIYAKFNGAAFYTGTQIAVLQSGNVAMNDVTGIGFRDVTVNYPADNPIFSNLATLTLDMRDFGLKASKTTGSMSSASTTLNVASAAGFAIGDPVIVEFGGEAGGGAYGTTGVGGIWPFAPAQYANATILQADHGQPAQTYGVDLSTNNVWFWGGATWGQLSPLNDYYLYKANGLALKAKITNITGNTITLDTPSTVATANANVYFNNFDCYDFVMRTAPAGNNYNVSTPVGTFSVWGGVSTQSSIALTARTGWKIFGHGSTQTVIVSPKGTLCATILAFGCTSCVIHDIGLQGNQGLSGYGLTLSAGNFKPGYPGLVDISASNFCETYNIAVVDTFGGVKGDNSNNCYTHDCSALLTVPPQVYLDWYFGWANCSDCIVQRCIAECDTGYFPAFEAFQSTRMSFLQCTTINGSCSTNSSSGYLFKDLKIKFKPNLWTSDVQFSHFNPIINCNSNIDHSQGRSTTPVSGLFLNCDVIQEGYNGFVDGQGQHWFAAIDIDQSTVNVTMQADPPWTQRPPGSPLTGGYISLGASAAPDWVALIRSDGGNVSNQSGDNFRVIGMRVDAVGFGGVFQGAIKNGSPAGIVQNCVVDTIVVGNGAEASANLTLAQWQAQKTKFYEFT